MPMKQMRPSRLVVLADQVCLPGNDGLQSAVFQVDLESGLIVSVQSLTSELRENDYPGCEVIHINPDHVVLPGLVE